VRVRGVRAGGEKVRLSESASVGQAQEGLGNRRKLTSQRYSISSQSSNRSTYMVETAGDERRTAFCHPYQVEKGLANRAGLFSCEWSKSPPRRCHLSLRPGQTNVGGEVLEVLIHRQWHLPLDPECEVVTEYAQSLGIDPAALSSWAGGETWVEFEHSHRRACERCALYGVQNMRMDEPLGFTVVA
jgi:hypothetical protein